MSFPKDAPTFREPWEAEAFALAVKLHEQGVFTWSEWAETLAAEITKAQQAGDPDLGDTYYHHWLAALERLIQAKGLLNAAEIETRHAAWDRAVRATPHGRPIQLEP